MTCVLDVLIAVLRITGDNAEPSSFCKVNDRSRPSPIVEGELANILTLLGLMLMALLTKALELKIFVIELTRLVYFRESFITPISECD